MNTEPKRVVRYQGRHCEHVSLFIAGLRVRVIRPVKPDLDPSTGLVVRGECAIPRCGRVSVSDYD